MRHVLIVDDEAAFRGMLEATVKASGFPVATASCGEEALASIAREEPGLVFLDLRMGSRAMSGIEALAAIRERHGDLPVVMVTAFGDVQIAVAAMKAGALDFMEKPIDLADVRRILKDVMSPAEAGREDDGREPIPFGGITPADGPMQAALELLAAAAGTDAPVLLTGESGTGKELAAAFVHERSARGSGPFVKVNCAAIPTGLLEVEMFGCVAGAYTGAARAREGLFAAAEGGTILLDEIAEMDVGLQAKLLRVVQEKELEPVGGARQIRIDVRVVASTNRPISAAIRAGAFREDLYYRLNVFEVVLPPLRERAADTLPLARHLVRELSGERPRRLSREAESLIAAYPWPGNVRELRNALERAVILARGGVVRPDHLPPNVAAVATSSASPATGAPGSPLPFEARVGASVHDMERELIARTLAATGGNRTRAAEKMGMSRRALLYKIKRYGIDG